MSSLSILIPTHDRQRYVIPTVRALAANLKDVEIVVCDTSATDELTPAFSELLESSRVKLIRPNRSPMSVVDNFRESVLHATGDYLLFIGDDDFVDSSAEKIARWALKNGVDSVRCTFPVSYYWPDFSSRYYGDGYSGKLSISNFSGAVTLVDAKAEYEKAKANLGAGVLKMPRAYLGMISRKLVLKIQSKHGSLFGGVSPDIFSASLISAESELSIQIDYPFVVPGSSGASTSGKSAMGTHKGSLRDNAHIAPFVNLQWDSRIPEFYSVPTVWSYSLVKAAESLGHDKSANYERLYIKCLLFHPGYHKETLTSVRYMIGKRGFISVAGRLTLAFLLELSAQAQRVGRRILRPRATGSAVSIASVADCAEAAGALTSYLATKSNVLILPTMKDLHGASSR